MRAWGLQAAFAGLSAAAICGGSAAAQATKGHWEAGEDARGASMYLMYPDYSPTNWAVLNIACDRARRTVTFNEDTGLNTRPRSASISLLVDGKPFSIAARAEFNEMDEFWLRIGSASYGSPVVKALAVSRGLGLASSPNGRVLPAAQFQTSLARFVRACGIG